MYDRPFRWWVQSVMPLVFDDSLSYYEVLAKLTKYIEGLTGDVEQIEKILGTIEGIEDVTQFTEFLERIQAEIGNLDNLQTQTKASLVSAINEVALKADIAYWKPPTGIPESDLSQEVQEKINRTIDATEFIINNRKLKPSPSNNSPSDLGLGTYTVPDGGIPWDTLSDDVKQRINAGGGGSSNYSDLDNKPQINGHTLNAGDNTAESLGLGTYTKPIGGIPESDLSAEVQEKLNTSGGIADNQEGFVASRDYEAGELLYINGVLYRTKYKILAGTNMIPGNNIETTDISAELEKINSDIDALQSGSGPDSWSLVANVSNDNYNAPTRFFEYFNAIGGENYLFIVTPPNQTTRDYTIQILKRDGTIVRAVSVDIPDSYAQYRFTFTPEDTGEYYCAMFTEYNAYPIVDLRVEIEYTQSQGISELWAQVNTASQLEPRVTALEVLVGEQQTELEQLEDVPSDVAELKKDSEYFENAIDNDSLMSGVMGFGKTAVSSGRTFEVLKNHVNTIVSASSSAYRGVNLFGTPTIFSCTTATMQSVVSALESYPIKIPEGYDLILVVDFDHANTTNITYICGMTKNDESGVITYKQITSDYVEKRIVNLTNLMPEIVENGNLCLAVINRHSASANNFVYHLFLEKKMVEAPFYYDIATGSTSETYGCKFVAKKYHIDAECVIPSSGTTAYRGCPILGSVSNFATISGGRRDFSGLAYYPINFDTDCYDLCMSVKWDNVYSNSANYIFVATKDENEQISRATVFIDHSDAKEFINIFKLLPKIKENKNIQFVFENQDRNKPNGFTYSFCLLNKNSIESTVRSELNVPDYYFDDGYINERIKTVVDRNNTMSNDIFKNDIFVWITDPHLYFENLETQYNGMQSAKLIKYLINNIRLPKVFCGGDLHNGNSMTPDASKKLIEEANKYFGIIDDRLYMVIGNHEWNNPGNDAGQAVNELNEQTLYNLIVKYRENEYISISTKMDYCFDNKPQKIRYFCINSTKEGYVWWQTVAWLADELTKVPSGYTVVVLSHVGLTGNDAISNVFTIITDVLDSAKNKEPFTYRSVTYEYSDFDADIACVISGHIHGDYSATTEAGIPVISTTCDRAATAATSSGTVKCVRKIGTIGEQAFDVVQIDTENKKIYMTRIGGSTIGAIYDEDSGMVVDTVDYDPDTQTIADGATRYNATEWIIHSPYKDREFSY